jgi:hypothetical protein
MGLSPSEQYGEGNDKRRCRTEIQGVRTRPRGTVRRSDVNVGELGAIKAKSSVTRRSGARLRCAVGPYHRPYHRHQSCLEHRVLFITVARPERRSLASKMLQKKRVRREICVRKVTVIRPLGNKLRSSTHLQRREPHQGGGCRAKVAVLVRGGLTPNPNSSAPASKSTLAW